MKTAAIAIATIALQILGACSDTAASSNADKTQRLVIAVGDSITQGLGANNPRTQGWPALIGAKRAGENSGCLISDPCFSGRPPMLATFDRKVLAQNPDVVIIAYGINDILHDPALVIAGLQETHAHAVMSGADTYVATLTPLRRGPYRSYNKRRVELNTMIRNTFGAAVIDFDAAISGKGGRLRKVHDSGDGLHPNEKAYTVMADVAAAKIG